MKAELISMFIDDELSLDEKMEFVETIGRDSAPRNETLALLAQEKLLRFQALPEREPLAAPRYINARRLMTATALVAAVVIAIILFPAAPQNVPHRFVFYGPDASQAEIVGSFTGWQPVKLEKIGQTGYWEITLALDPGQQRYAYVVDSRQRLADPSVVMCEDDDFGGKNSIIMIGGES